MSNTLIDKGFTLLEQLLGRTPPAAAPADGAAVAANFPAQQVAGRVVVLVMVALVSLFVAAMLLELLLAYGIVWEGTPSPARHLAVGIALMNLPAGLLAGLLALVDLVALFTRPGRATHSWLVLTVTAGCGIVACAGIALAYQLNTDGAVADLRQLGAAAGQAQAVAGRLQAMFWALATWYLALLTPLLLAKAPAGPAAVPRQ